VCYKFEIKRRFIRINQILLHLYLNFMLKFLFIFTAFAVMRSAGLYAQNANNPAVKLAYHLSWDGQSPLLKVKLEYTPATSDSTVFIFGDPMMGGQTEIFKVLKNVQCDGADKIKLTPKERKITVYHTGGGPKTITYQVDGHLLTDPKRATVNELFRPLITPKILYLTTLYFMLNPANQGAAVVSLQWDSFPDNVPYFISIAAGSPASQKQTINALQEKDVLILMGPDLVIGNYKVHGIPYYSITSKSDTLNNMTAELTPFFNNYFPDLRDFWHDNSGTYYYLCVLPLLGMDKPWATGFGWGQGFVMKYSGKFDDDKRHVLAHETSHTWIGNGMQIGTDEFNNQWFGEGFNDYITVCALVKSGIYDNAAFVSYINKENLAPHYASTVKSLPNDSIAARFWTDHNVQTLPYKRGFIYAFYLDNEIRLASGGKKNIRNFLLALFKRNKAIKAANPQANLTMSDFLTTASAFIPEREIKQQIDTYMLLGTPLDFKKLKLINAFKITYYGEIPVLSVNQNIDLKTIYRW
jgi:predicted metalloprotease with PDZ domain